MGSGPSLRAAMKADPAPTPGLRRQSCQGGSLGPVPRVPFCWPSAFVTSWLSPVLSMWDAGTEEARATWQELPSPRESPRCQHRGRRTLRLPLASCRAHRLWSFSRERGESALGEAGGSLHRRPQGLAPASRLLRPRCEKRELAGPAVEGAPGRSQEAFAQPRPLLRQL